MPFSLTIYNGGRLFKKAIISPDRIIDTLDEMLYKSVELKINPLIILSKSWRSLNTIQQSKEFKNVNYSSSERDLRGYYKGKPVFNFHHDGDPNILVVDFSKFGVWEQYSPKQTLENERNISKEFTLYIRKITEDLAKEMIRDRPTLREDSSGGNRELKEVVRELQTKVQLRIVEQFDYHIINPAACLRILVNK